MKILLLGKNGQVGWELQRALSPIGEVIALDRHSLDYCGDLANPEGIARTVRDLQPNVIVNAAAYTAVDKAESDIENATLINAVSVEILARASREINALLVHYSTDYVFDGSGDRPWREEDITAPLNTYGETKRQGEEAIIAHAANYLIFRTSWVYAAKGSNFAKTMIRLALERETLSVINDQFGAPTGAELIADCTVHAIKATLLNPEKSGIYHMIASGVTTWHAYAEFVIEYVRNKGLPLRVSSVNGVETTAFPTPAKRPHNSRLNTEKLRDTFAITLPEWQQGVMRMLDELYS
ncbi:dTDP-4-dehydrorhamnose reductase [Pantoea sp. PA1]|jgi:dTDP-4-dehydrorhamnose reductase|uniref:dTDP-4-dehydrorhamnose reductase n=1 Tax=Pantoea TaxID=53335 RepID=UPI000309277E|nr:MULTISPECIES: dTDP-4-dehydrorhamnose reductase [Pantoea]MDH0052614.1 dTDP-4-dehydrorhamnose reductase [Pantoea ananatis]MDI3365317.1 dTDP-4-dehydrorhamnose reductase [Pantoea sp. V108_6]MDQ1226546.1 dTDP-4-dehydrorhamnose reductase [Pantoea ananatis]MDR6088424.1 dTDP-4-dehydrorhamnose reductase [Pantoea ananatis]PQK92262.1 dTDP-4-dehydrorhamnose reductase [Pantoea ananatis]